MTLNQQEALEFLRALELDPNAHYQLRDFKKQWRKLSLRYHPDKHTEESFAEYQKQVASHQKEGKKFEGEHVLEPKVAHAKFLEITHAYNMLTDKSYARKEKLGGRPVVDLDVTIPISVSFEEAFFGSSRVICLAVKEFNEDGECLNDVPNGKTTEVNELHVEIPAGTCERIVINLPNQGCICGKRRGRVEVVVQPMASDRFEMDRDGNVTSKVAAPLKSLLKGGELEVLTMYGIRTTRIPPGTQPGKRLRIPNCGVEQQGHHIGVVQIPRIPNEAELVSDSAWNGLDLDFSMKEGKYRDEQDEELQSIFLSMRNNKLNSEISGDTNE